MSLLRMAKEAENVTTVNGVREEVRLQLGAIKVAVTSTDAFARELQRKARASGVVKGAFGIPAEIDPAARQRLREALAAIGPQPDKKLFRWRVGPFSLTLTKRRDP